MHAVFLLLACVSSAFAYSVIVPNASQGWTNQGAQTLTWQRVESDRLNFTALLTNQRVQGYEPQVLSALVDGTLGTVNLNPPSGGWPTGSGFRLNLVQDANNLNAILAQSPEFAIAPASTTSVRTTAATTNTIATPATTTTAASDPTTSDTLTLPTTGTGGALASYSANTGFLALFSLLGFILA
ncbi:unnamed protein product [Cyclocybe aegerita]|uniref:Yeast cell wall synthesis Kre9/Knh1-like N-terminal domain-containing protein n=1 Tax=Cyclocybe aegerita TaxID=1973307 RepID=A0A8S0VQD6_CYCAE|nr:unnamed protein product [Cyclocybe aegerita]